MNEKYKRYIIFEIESYYPSGGLNDVIAEFETMEEVVQYFQELPPSQKAEKSFQIFDCDERVMVDIP
jgi:hypothetical protein